MVLPWCLAPPSLRPESCALLLCFAGALAVCLGPFPGPVLGPPAPPKAATHSECMMLGPALSGAEKGMQGRMRGGAGWGPMLVCWTLAAMLDPGWLHARDRYVGSRLVLHIGAWV